MFRVDDTIAAISTAAGAAPRAIVRISGPRAVAISEGLFVSDAVRLDAMGGFRAADGRIRLTPRECNIACIELPVRVYLFRRPMSFTRDDLVEFHVPGCPSAARLVLDAMIDAGARQADPGEFTARAFMSGRIDLSQAEAVADVINAADDARLRSAMAALGGEVHSLAADAARTVAEILADVEASIDLAEEDIASACPANLREALAVVAGRLAVAAENAGYLPDSAELPQVVIAGRPNVGKSSLLNALTQTDRAITSALAGTTRDVLGGRLTLPGGSTVNLLDAAGFCEAVDSLGRSAGEAARNAVERADMIIFVMDATAGDASADKALLENLQRLNARAPLVVLLNKCDLPAAEAPPLTNQDTAVIRTSAVTTEGLDALRAYLCDALHISAGRAGQALGLHDRQRRCLLRAGDSTRQAGQLLGGETEHVADAAELVAVELRDALSQLGAISGQIVTEDILGRIFARFCVGK